MPKKIERNSLLSLEAYAKQRPQFRAQVMGHKKNRTVLLGPNMTLIFEDELTIRYQIQEMLRSERIFEDEGIQDELAAYNPLIPDGRNFKATLMLEYSDIQERQRALARVKGIEERVWMQVEKFDRVYAIADEDLEGESEEKTSSVHFLRFELTDDMAAALQGGAALAMGVDHAEYRAELSPVSPVVRNALLRDLA